jgi:sarcosine oxidase subunit gamma
MAEVGSVRHGLEARIERLAARAGGENALQVAVMASTGHANLRGRRGDARFVEAVESVLGQSLPLEPNTVSEGRRRLFWLGPDEWLLSASRDELPELLGRLEEAVKGLHAAVNDLSDGQILLRLSGRAAGDVLAAGCTLDLHPDAFPPGRCAQTGLGNAAVLVCPLDSPGSFDLLVRRSFADYLLHWLARVSGSRGLSPEVR